LQKEWKFVDYREVLPKQVFIEKLKNSKFCICVHGGGYDPCPRFFEAILYGAIPIIEHSPLDTVFSKLPVVFVDKWTVDNRLLVGHYFKFQIIISIISSKLSRLVIIYKSFSMFS